MDSFVVKGGKRLRCGFTTGSCAAGAAKAAAQMLLTGDIISQVLVTTPSGVKLELEILSVSKTDGAVSCAVCKDAGDDPDVTNGVLVFAKVNVCGNGFYVEGGEGVGVVTKEGLACTVGEPAINPVPRQMIEQALRQAAESCGYDGGLKAQIYVPGGDKLAQRTLNPMLGIEGGISILGTSGIVEPMSEKAVIDTIFTSIDSYRAQGNRLLILTPGNYGRDFAAGELDIDLSKTVKCSNYIGSAVDYACYKEFEKILIIGHAGKLIKLAAGIFQTHSSTADGRQEILTSHAALAGGSRELAERLMESITVDGAIELLEHAGISRQVLMSIGKKMDLHLSRRIRRTTDESCRAAIIMFSARRGELYRSENAEEFLKLAGEAQA